MIIEIFDKDNLTYGIHVYENNENGEVFLQDTYHCDAKVNGYDDIFGTNDEKITVYLEGDEIMEERICQLLEESVNNKFENLDWVHYDYNTETNILSWTFIDNGETEEEFFNKMVEIKEYVKSLEYSAELIKFPKDCKHNYYEATININIYGAEL